ncbi:hypothetical protein GCK72_021229 [Caenorhabditis remanei]|uniref:Sdz-33 F-box domain-containing protein n=1 Tax=Caenorhabditis remanei TaxID=31234 RepID=A0A6A5GJ67_CAERE|nr:hypothetical protein GCK72_021229 [Caenorhabditis remanei]KAF1754666.1 hypothetical protein GCK72_021229 [Caenorhabditis remanei]
MSLPYYDTPIRKVKFSLNDLMMANAKTLELYNVILNAKDMNHFFKLWMKNKCNPRLEYLEVRINGNINNDFLLKGLKTVPVPVETKKTFQVLGNVQQLRLDEKITAEFDITRVDGRTATIRMSTFGTVYFYVWPESTNLEPISRDSIDLVVNSHDIEMRIADLTLHFYGNVSETVWMSHRNKLVDWKNAGLSTKQLIQRVLAVTKCTSLRKLILRGEPDYDVFSILDVVTKVSCLPIPSNCSNTFATQALQVLSPVTSEITLFKLPFSSREEFQRLWMGIVECLSVYNDDLSRFQFNINDLLASNAIKLELCEVKMSLRDLNRFFSSWLNNTSNHRLNHLSVKLLGHFNEDVLLDELDAIRFTEERTREFRSTSTFPKFR